MYIQKVILKNFRNYENMSIEFSPSLNIIFGYNGTGKSNILEALSVASTLRSFRNNHDQDMIRWGKSDYYCSAEVADNEEKLFEVGCMVHDSRMRKKAKIDNKEIKNIFEYYGRLLTVIFSPWDINIINGAPDLRRRFIDSVISKIDITYLEDLSDFKKILLSRNRYLKALRDNKAGDLRELDVWDQLFAEKSSRIIQRRYGFISEFREMFMKSYAGISGEDGSPCLSYHASLDETDQEYISRKLMELRNRDLILGSTCIGPQRDDFILKNTQGIHFTNYASQGQRRTAAICLKIAECEAVESTNNKRAVIMIDDVFSELDEERRANMIDLLHRDNQIIITMVDRSSIDTAFRETRDYNISHGGTVKRIDD